MARPPKPRTRSTRHKIGIVSQFVIPLAVAVIPKLVPDHGQAAATKVVVQAPAPAAAQVQPVAPLALPAPDAAPPPAPIPTGIAPAACLRRFQAIGLPYQRGDDAAANEVLVCRRGYALGYDGTTHDPDWVIEHISPGDLTGTAKRSNKFGQDPALAAHDASLADYRAADAAGHHFDRGHQAPAGDAKFDQAVMDQSFYLTNMAPQVGIGFNRGAWKYLEETVRSWVLCGGHKELFVITGPIYPDRSADTIGTDKVIVPRAFFKIVYDPAGQRAVGFVLKNEKLGAKLANLQDYVVPITNIEGETGLAFFRNLDLRTQSLLKDQAGVAWGHIGTCSTGGSD